MLDKFDEFDAVIINPSASASALEDAIADRISRVEATVSILALAGIGNIPETHHPSFDFTLWGIRNMLLEIQQLQMRFSQLARAKQAA